MKKISIEAKIKAALERLAERQTQLSKTKTSCEARCDKATQGNAECAESAAALKESMEASHALAVTYLNSTYKEGIEKIALQVKEATTAAVVDRLGTDLTEHCKKQNKLAVHDFTQSARSLMQASQNWGRKQGASATERRTRAARNAVAASKPPLWTHLMDEQDDETINTTTSIYEAKAGVRGALMNVMDMEAYNNIAKQPIVIKATKAAAQALKAGGEAYSQEIKGGKQVLRRFEQVLVATVGPDARTKLVTPASAPWAQKVWAAEIIATADNYTQANWAPFGMMTAYMMLKGTATFAGIRTERIEGNTFAEKRSNVLRMEKEELFGRIRDGGWMAKFDSAITSEGHTTIIIPTGFFILIAADKATMLRWNLSSDATDTARVKYTIKGMMDSFVELHSQDSGYDGFVAFLGAHSEPASSRLYSRALLPIACDSLLWLLRVKKILSSYSHLQHLQNTMPSRKTRG